ncbi:MAG: alpha/beta fold hydrolase [Anaerolineae bacterium]|nr:alpha/beta fold hydrolase [Anaerolineae bacterium]
MMRQSGGRAMFKERELEVLRLLAQGLTNKQIGGRLSLATETVRWYTKEIYGKLGVNGRGEAVYRARTLGLLTDDDSDALPTPEQSAAQSPIRYTRSGDVHIAYRVIGGGPVDLVLINGFVSHVEVALEEPEVADFLARLGEFTRVILFDKRGVGLSDRIGGAPTLEDTMADVLAVMNAAGSERAVLLGVSEGGAASLLMAVTYPELVSALIIYGATPKLARRGEAPKWAIPVDAFTRALDLMERSWGGPYAVEGFAPSRAHDPAFRDWWSRLLRLGASPGSARAVWETLRDIDVRDLLPSVRVPTLILHRDDDRMIRVGAARYMAEQIPGARFVELPGSDHFFWVKGHEITREIEAFLDDLDSAPQVEQVLLTAVCAQFQPPLPPALEASLQALVERHHGRLRLSDPSGCTATFDGPSRAIQCACRARDLLAEHGVALRAGIHTGEFELAADQLGGPMLAATQAIAGAAALGEVLASQTTVDLIAGAAIEASAHGELALAALHRPLMLYAVDGVRVR